MFFRFSERACQERRETSSADADHDPGDASDAAEGVDGVDGGEDVARGAERGEEENICNRGEEVEEG